MLAKSDNISSWLSVDVDEPTEDYICFPGFIFDQLDVVQVALNHSHFWESIEDGLLALSVAIEHGDFVFVS